MKKILLFFTLFSSVATYSQVLDPAHWSFEVRELPGNEVELLFHLRLDEGWQIFSQHSDPNGPIPTEFTFERSPSFSTIGKVQEPSPRKAHDDIFGIDVSYFAYEIYFTQKIHRNTNSSFVVKGTVSYQLSKNGSCLAPDDRRFAFTIPAVAEQPVAQSAQPASPSATANSSSDADINIPQSNRSNDGTYVFIVANEDYPNRHVPYALNDGRIFAQYCNKTLGIPQNHIKLYENATSGQLVACVASIKKASEANDGDIDVIFYYAGHAFPDEETKEAYLLPVDGDNQLVETCFSLKRLYQQLGAIKAKSVVCLLDACFSGATREDNMLLAGRGVAIKPKEETPQGNLVVLTSASGNETAHQYEAKQHGLFTYYLLKKLQQSKGTLTLGELYDYLSKNVKRTSYDVNQKIQTPSVVPSQSMTSQWRTLRL